MCSFNTSPWLIKRPRQDKSPISIPNILIDKIVRIESPIKSDFPIFKFVYLFIIIAIISVPPLDADKLNKIDEPRAGIKTAQNNSNNLL